MTSIVVRLFGPCGRYRLTLSPQCTMADLRKEVSTRTSVEESLQILSFDAESVNHLPREDDITLQECKVGNGTQVFLRIGVCSAPKSKSSSVSDTEDCKKSCSLTSSRASEQCAELLETSSLRSAKLSDDLQIGIHSATKSGLSSVSDKESCKEGAEPLEISSVCSTTISDDDRVEIRSASKSESDTESCKKACSLTFSQTSEQYAEVLETSPFDNHLLDDAHAQVPEEHYCTYQLVHGFTGEAKCFLRGHLQETIADLMQSALAKLDCPRDTDLVFMKDNKVLHDDFKLQDAGLVDNAEIQFLIIGAEQAISARHQAALQHRLEGLDQLMDLVPPQLDQNTFGPDLAWQVATALSEGYQIKGRARLQCQRRTISSATTESWSLAKGVVHFPKKTLITEPLLPMPSLVHLAVHGHCKRQIMETVICGQIVFKFGSFQQMWNSNEEFVEFFKDMSEKRFAALCASILHRPDSTRKDATYSILDTLSRQHLIKKHMFKIPANIS